MDLRHLLPNFALIFRHSSNQQHSSRPGLYCAAINHKPSIIDIKTDLSALWRACVQTRLLTHLWVNFISPLMQNSIFIWILNISGYPIDITCILKDWFLSHLEAYFRSTLWLHTYISTIPIRKWIPHVRMESYSCVFHHLGSFLRVSETKTVQPSQPSPSLSSSTWTLYINNVQVETVSVSVLLGGEPGRINWERAVNSTSLKETLQVKGFLTTPAEL